MGRLKRYLALMRLELRSVLSGKVFGLGILVQLIVILGLGAMVTGLSSAYGVDPSAAAGKRVLLSGQGEASSVLTSLLVDKGLVVSQTDQGSFDAIVTVSESGIGGDDLIFVDITLRESLSTPAVLNVLRASLEELQELARISRGSDDEVTIPRLQISGIDSIGYLSRQFSFETTYVMVIPLILLLPIIISGGLVNDSIMEEKESKTLHLLLASPVRLFWFYASKMSVHFLIGLAQVLAWLGLLPYISIQVGNLVPLILVVLGLDALFILVGAFVTTRFRSKTQSHLAYSLVSTFIILAWFVLPDSPIDMIVELAAGVTRISLVSVATFATALPLAAYLVFRYSRRVEGADHLL